MTGRTSCSCRTPGTWARRGCSSRSASRRLPRPAAVSPPRWAGSTDPSPATKHSRTQRRWWLPCRCTGVGRPRERLRRRARRRGRDGLARQEDGSGRLLDRGLQPAKPTRSTRWGLAVDRVQAAAEAAHGSSPRIVLTARAENHIRGVDDLDDTIRRLQAFEDVGADVLFAPGRFSIERHTPDRRLRRPTPERARSPRRPTGAPSWRPQVRGGSRSVAASHTPRSAPWSRRVASSSTKEPSAIGSERSVGGEVARAAFQD